MIQTFLSIAYSSILSLIFFGAKPPEAVIEAFDKKFPDASELKWDKEGDHAFMASFYFNDIAHKAKFSDKGKWLETITTIEYDALPEKVKASLDKNHEGAKIKSVAKSETSLGKIKYLVEIKKLIKSEELVFMESGKEMTR